MIKLDFFGHIVIFIAIMKSCFYTILITSLLLLLPCAGVAAQESLPQDRSSAVIFAYYRVGEDQFPGANIRMEQFQSHIRELKDGGYHVMALPEIIAALKSGTTLPDRTVALTFDGGYNSILQNAVPLLLENNFPFTVFVATDYLDRNSSEYMSWLDLKKMAKNKLVTIGLHPSLYTHMAGSAEDEVRRQVNNARTRVREMLGQEPALFAYPFGEYSSTFRNVAASSGFEAAFGQQSGVAYAGEDLFTLPRFPMTESFGDMDRFQMTASALPLPVSDEQPKDPHLDTLNPVIGFTVDQSLKNALKNISCFASGQEQKPRMEFVGGGRVELRFSEEFGEEKARINCTLPGPQGEADEAPRWRWYGMLMTIPAEMSLTVNQ